MTINQSNLYNKASQNTVRFLLSFIVLLFVLFSINKENIPFSNGLGFDGAFYGDITANFKEYIKNKSINKYYFQRTAIPCVINFFMDVFNIKASEKNIITSFHIVNLVFLMFSFLYYFLISSFLKFSKKTEVLGFIALFICFPVIKFSGYYPVLMDIPALGIAFALLYYYLKDKIVVFFLILLFGTFVFPNFIVFSVLFLFKKIDLNNEEKTNNWSKADKLISVTIKTLISIAMAVLFTYAYIALFWRSSYELISSEFKINLWNTIYIWTSFLFAMIFLLLFTIYSNIHFRLNSLLRMINVKGILLTVFVYLFSGAIIKAFASTEAPPLTLENYLYNIAYQAVKNPFNFFVAHHFYFGMLFLLIPLFSKSIKKQVKTYGLGAILFFNLFFFFSLGSESRQLINFFPFIFVFVLIVIDKTFNVSWIFVFLFSLLNFGLSHVWYSINKGISATTDYTDYFKKFEFPLQRYFMFQGPWVSDYMYKIHLMITIFLILLLFFAIKKRYLIDKIIQ